MLKGEIETQLFSRLKHYLKLLNRLYISNYNVSYTLSTSRTNFRNLHLVIISNACFSNGTHLFLTLHGMQGVRGSNPLGSIQF